MLSEITTPTTRGFATSPPLTGRVHPTAQDEQVSLTPSRRDVKILANHATGRKGIRLAAEHRPRPALSAAIAGVLLLVGLALAVLLLPGKLEKQQAYDSAPTCPTAEPAPGCLSQTPVTLVDKERRNSGKNRPHYMLFSRDGRLAQWVRMGGGSHPVYSAAQPGDTVTATYWDGQIVEVTFQGQRETSAQEPDHNFTGFLFLTSLPLVAGGFATVVAFRHLGGRTLLKPDIKPLAAMGVGVGTLAGGLLGTAIVTGVLKALLTR